MKAWILGAGFSRRLGGPLLFDLLDVHAVRRLRTRFPNVWPDGSWLHESKVLKVAQACQRGIEKGFWPHAEEFLVMLSNPDAAGDAADLLAEAYDGGEYQALERSGLNHQDLYFVASALVAAQCMVFLDRSRADNEGWLPYDRWVAALPTEDVLVSFNYDLVVENAFQRSKVKRHLHVPNPREAYDVNEEPGCSMLLKLHGSVSFRDSIHLGVEDGIPTLVSNPCLIGIPGSEKSDLSDSDFGGLWEYAFEALCRADEVAVIGYRCPETDEMSKSMILDALARNQRDVTVDVVLGPGSGQDVLRMESLLKSTGAKVVDTRLYAQDYLCAFGTGKGWHPRESPE